MLAGGLASNFTGFVSPVSSRVTLGTYFISGGTDNPNTPHTWDSGTGSYVIHGLDPRTVDLHPSFGSGGSYTFTKLSSFPSTLGLGQTSSNCWFTFTAQGQSITIQVTRGAESHVITFAFAP